MFDFTFIYNLQFAIYIFFGRAKEANMYEIKSRRLRSQKVVACIDTDHTGNLIWRLSSRIEVSTRYTELKKIAIIWKTSARVEI